MSTIFLDDQLLDAGTSSTVKWIPSMLVTEGSIEVHEESVELYDSSIDQVQAFFIKVNVSWWILSSRFVMNIERPSYIRARNFSVVQILSTTSFPSTLEENYPSHPQLRSTISFPSRLGDEQPITSSTQIHNFLPKQAWRRTTHHILNPDPQSPYHRTFPTQCNSSLDFSSSHWALALYLKLQILPT